MNDAAKKDVEAALSMQMLGDTSFAALAPRWMLDRSKGGAEVFIDRDPELKKACVYAAFSTAEGAWQVVLRRPQSEVMKQADQSIMTHAIVGAVLIILGAGTMFLVSRGVAIRVRDAAAAADRIARGDLTREVVESSAADETGGLVRSMRSMDSNLSSLIGDVKLAAVRLNSTATEIAATSRQQEATTGTFGAASSQVAAAVKEISATSRDLVRTMEKVNRNAQESAELAGTGREGLQGMESVMNELTAGSRSIAEKLGAISDRSEKITAVVTMIAKVADQTNILSINAAIEAEKAGEVGAGFLVIAREIRRLADQTAGATLEIEQMVRQMQGAVGAGVKEMDRFGDQVRRGGKEVTTAGALLTGIINRVNSSTQEIRVVNEAIQAQSEGAQQISDAMSSLAGGAGQTAQAAREFGRAAADLQEAIATLREAISKFRLRE